jgi:hypothetical protein
MRVFSVALLLALGVAPALAQRAPNIVIPGRPGVPVIINGVDASWGVVEGEFGLDRPGATAPVVVYRPFVVDEPVTVPAFFPRSGVKPGYGRLEITPPPGPRPPPAPTYYRSWTSESAPGPVTDYAPFPMPQVVVDPWIGSRRHGRGPGHGKP